MFSRKKCYVLCKRKCHIKASRKSVGTKRKNNNLSNIFDFLHVTRRLRVAYILTLQSLNIYIYKYIYLYIIYVFFFSLIITNYDLRCWFYRSIPSWLELPSIDSNPINTHTCVCVCIKATKSWSKKTLHIKHLYSNFFFFLYKIRRFVWWTSNALVTFYSLRIKDSCLIDVRLSRFLRSSFKLHSFLVKSDSNSFKKFVKRGKIFDTFYHSM